MAVFETDSTLPLKFTGKCFIVPLFPRWHFVHIYSSSCSLMNDCVCGSIPRFRQKLMFSKLNLQYENRSGSNKSHALIRQLYDAKIVLIYPFIARHMETFTSFGDTRKNIFVIKNIENVPWELDRRNSPRRISANGNSRGNKCWSRGVQLGLQNYRARKWCCFKIKYFLYHNYSVHFIFSQGSYVKYIINSKLKYLLIFVFLHIVLGT